MSGKIISMDIGDKNIKLIEGKKRGDALEVNKAVIAPVPEGTLEDGRIKDIFSLKEAIKDILVQNKIKASKVTLTIQSTSVITRELNLPLSKEEDMRNMVAFEIEQYLPILASEYVIEYTYIDKFIEDDVKKAKVRVAAMPNNIVNEYYNLLKDIGLKPVALDIHSNAVSKLFAKNRLLNREFSLMEKTFALIDLGYQSLNVHILSNGQLSFSRIISLGGLDIDKDISFNYSISLKDSEIKKIKEGYLNQDTDVMSLKSLSYIIKTNVDTWISEMQKIFRYYISRDTGNRIDTIYLFGGSSSIIGLDEYIEQVLNIKTERISKIEAVKLKKWAKDADIALFINTLGGMIRYDKR